MIYQPSTRHHLDTQSFYKTSQIQQPSTRQYQTLYRHISFQPDTTQIHQTSTRQQIDIPTYYQTPLINQYRTKQYRLNKLLQDITVDTATYSQTPQTYQPSTRNQMHKNFIIATDSPVFHQTLHKYTSLPPNSTTDTPTFHQTPHTYTNILPDATQIH